MKEGPPTNTPENQPPSTAEDVQKAFEAMKGSASEGANLKIQEYDERIRAAKAGTPIKPGDTVDGLLNDFKSFAKQDWSEDFNIDDFKKNKEKAKNATTMKDPTPQSNQAGQEKAPEQQPQQERQRDPSEIVIRDTLELAFGEAKTPEESERMRGALEKMNKLFKIEDADVMHNVERLIHKARSSEKNLNWTEIVNHYFEFLPEKQQERVRELREKDPKKFDALSKDMMEGLMKHGAIKDPEEKKQAAKKLFTDLEQQYQWKVSESGQKSIQQYGDIIYQLREKLGDKNITPEEAKKVEKDVADTKGEIKDFLKRGGTIGGIIIGLAIGGMLLAFLFELALLETVTKKIK